MSKISQLKSDLNSLQVRESTRTGLDVLSPVGSRPATKGRGTYTPPASASAGIASPLKEEDITKREYYDTETVMSSDGLIWLEWQQIKAIVMTDANGSTARFEYEQQTDETTS